MDGNVDQHKYPLLTLPIHCHFIVLLHWEIRPPEPSPDIPLSHIVLKPRSPILVIMSTSLGHDTYQSHKSSVWIDRKLNSWPLSHTCVLPTQRHHLVSYQSSCRLLAVDTHGDIRRALLLLTFYILATSKVISRWVPTCNSAHTHCTITVLPHWQMCPPESWPIFPTQSHFPVTILTSHLAILSISRAKLGSDEHQVYKSLV